MADVKKLHRGANNKVSRLKGKEINVAGTEHDVRRDIKKVSRYTAKQLATYKSQLESFNDRSTRFIGDANGNPMDLEAYKIYKEREKAVKAKQAKQHAKIANIKLPIPGVDKKGNATFKSSPRSQTVNERNVRILPTRPAGKDRTTNSTFKTAERKPRNFKSEKSLEVMSKAMAKRLDPNYRKEQIAEQRRILGDMLNVINAKKLTVDLHRLSDDQFDLMWNNTSMPDDVKEMYLIMKKALEADYDDDQEKLDAFYNDENDTHIERIGLWLDWAGSVKLNG